MQSIVSGTAGKECGIVENPNGGAGEYSFTAVDGAIGDHAESLASDMLYFECRRAANDVGLGRRRGRVEGWERGEMG
jgi:hypothetical protein